MNNFQKLLKIAELLKNSRYAPNFKSIKGDLAAPIFRGLSNYGFTHVDYTMDRTARWTRLQPEFEKFFQKINDYLRIQPKGFTIKKIGHKNLEDQKAADVFEVEKAGKTFQFALVQGEDVYAIYTTDPNAMWSLL